MTDASHHVMAEQSPANVVQPIDRAKVERLKQAIASGTYTVNEELIADKLIEQEFPDALTGSKSTETAVTGGKN